MAKVRLGVVLLVPQPAATEVDGLRRACGDSMLGAIPPHITLVPPVNVRRDDMAWALATVRAAAAGVPGPLELTIGPARTFLPETPVVYLAVGGDLDPVRRLRDAVFREPLARKVSWKFVPHVTIADQMEPERIPAAVAALASFQVTVPISRVELLMEQYDDDNRRVWHPVADVPFGPRAVIGRGGLPLEITASELLDPEARSFAEREWAGYSFEQYGVAAESTLAVAARRDGRVVGVATGDVRVDEAYLARLIVDADHRSEGVGGHLLAAFEHEARTRGCTVVSLRTRAGGDADRFYRERGYVEHSRLPDWRYGHDFVRLVRRLPEG